jgi:esterase/lipase superfamily enzyme
VRAAPDIDLSVFRQQLARLYPSHFFVLAALNDRALSIMSHSGHV